MNSEIKRLAEERRLVRFKTDRCLLQKELQEAELDLSEARDSLYQYIGQICILSTVISVKYDIYPVQVTSCPLEPQRQRRPSDAPWQRIRIPSSL